MEHSVTAFFFDRPGSPTEKEAKGIMESLLHRFIGQGTNMISGERDVQYAYQSEIDAFKISRLLRNAGYRVSQHKLRSA